MNANSEHKSTRGRGGGRREGEGVEGLWAGCTSARVATATAAADAAADGLSPTSAAAN